MKKLMVQYTIFTYLFFWLFIALIGFVMLVLELDTLSRILMNVSAWSPTIIFALMFRKIYPSDNLLSFIKRRFSSSIKPYDILAPLLIHAAIVFITIFAFSLTRSVPFLPLLVTSPAALAFIFLNCATSGATGEELGWRGFLQPEIQKKRGPVQTSLIIGLIWSFWHTPLWFATSGLSGVDLLIFIVFFVVLNLSCSLFITYFFNKSGNLFSAIWIHFLINVSTGVMMDETEPFSFIVFTALYVVITVILFIHRHMCEKKNNMMRS